jgi:hypothetical protein
LFLRGSRRPDLPTGPDRIPQPLISQNIAAIGPVGWATRLDPIGPDWRRRITESSGNADPVPSGWASQGRLRSGESSSHRDGSSPPIEKRPSVPTGFAGRAENQGPHGFGPLPSGRVGSNRIAYPTRLRPRSSSCHTTCGLHSRQVGKSGGIEEMTDRDRELVSGSSLIPAVASPTRFADWTNFDYATCVSPSACDRRTSRVWTRLGPI